MSSLKGSMDQLLPHDDELVRRENLFLNLFDKFSIDEGSDPELGDIDSTEDTIANNSDSGSSFSEASSNESCSDDSSVFNKMKEDLQPVIQDRVNSWPEKGINLQLKTVDPGVTVEEWLRANNEFTTTSKKYKKTVVTEKNRTVITTTKQTKTTTKKSLMHSFIPRFLQKDVESVKELGNEVKAISNVRADLHTIPSTKESALQTKQKAKVKSKKDKNRIANDLIAKNTIPNPAYPSDRHKKEKSIKEFPKHQEAVNSSSNSFRSNAMVLPLENGTKRFLRPRVPRKESTIVSTEKLDNKPKERIRYENADKKQSNSRVLRNHTNQDKVEQNDVKVKVKTSMSADLPLENGTKRVTRSRSPLKEKTLNRVSRQINLTEEYPEMKKVRVNLRNVQPTTMNDRTQKNTFAEAATNSLHEMRAHSDMASYYDTICSSNTKAHKSLTNQSRRQTRPKIRQIVIHSPGYKTMLGRKLDDKYMLVKKSDYSKHIHPKDLQSMDESVMNDSIVPINRRIVYVPPTTIIEGSSEDDSECEDELLTSYTNTGHLMHINLK